LKALPELVGRRAGCPINDNIADILSKGDAAAPLVKAMEEANLQTREKAKINATTPTLSLPMEAGSVRSLNWDNDLVWGLKTRWAESNSLGDIIG
jgi:hypothetical protein